jgi:hypothetical protein
MDFSLKNANHNFTIADKLAIIMSWKLNRVTEAISNNGWNPHQRFHAVHEAVLSSFNFLGNEKFDTPDLETLNLRERFMLGFRLKVVDAERMIWMLPFWIVPHLKPGIQVLNQEGKSHFLSVSGVVNTEGYFVEGGCIPFGIRHPNIEDQPDPDIESVLVPHELRTDEHN